MTFRCNDGLQKNRGRLGCRPPTWLMQSSSGWDRLSEIPVAAAIVITAEIVIVTEVEQVEQIADRRHVDGNVGIVVVDARIGQVIAAALGELAEMPVALDELHKGGVFIVDVADVTTPRER